MKIDMNIGFKTDTKIGFNLYTANNDNFEIHVNKMRNDDKLVKYGTSLIEHFYRKN